MKYFALLLLFIGASAQAAPMDFFSIGSAGRDRGRWKLIFAGLYAPKQALEGQGKDAGWNESEAELRIPLFHDEKDSWNFTIKGDRLGLPVAGEVRFPATGEHFPEQLWNAAGSLSYSRRISGDRSYTFAAGYGSRADKPFASKDENYVNANFSYQIPAGLYDSWIIGVSYSTERSFLSGVPLPGFAYFYNPSEEFRAILGVPFAGVFWKPMSKLMISASYLVPYFGQVKVGYSLMGPVQAYLQLRADLDSYRLHGRANKDERLAVTSRDISAGIAYPLEQWASVDMSAGYTFGRAFILAEKYSQRHTARRLDLADGAYAALKLNISL